MKQFFYSKEICKGKISLIGTEFRHCIRVLRKKIGDNINVVDGNGNLYDTKLINIDLNACTLEIKNKVVNYNKRNYRVHLAISPTKNHNRIDWFLEKAVEIGVDEITFIHCQNSQRSKVNIDRCEKILISAMKQSLKAEMPKLNPILDFNIFIKNTEQEKKYIGYVSNGENNHLSYYCDNIENVLVCIGPEGDFSAAEIKNALHNEFQCISLGNSRYRTETAGLVALMIININNAK